MPTESSPLHALVTGASRGIGRAIAQRLASRGVRVAVHFARNELAAKEVVAALPGSGHRAFQADLEQPTAAEDLWQKAEAASGRIDLLINNAGIYAEHPPLTTDAAAWQDAWRRTLATNLVGPAMLCHSAARSFTSRSPRGEWGRGRIVSISSRGAFRGEPDAAAYGASKAGLNSLSQSLAKALAPEAIFVFCLAPGWVETDMAAEFLSGPQGASIRDQHPLGRVTSADEVARAAEFCALDAPAAMTGAILDVNGASYLRT
jgi:3-oxoacyl-[acyl-carrier protein] reductase